MTHEQPLARVLAEWAGALRWEALSPGHREAACLWVLDTLGVMLAAAPLPPGRAVREVACRQGGGPEATLVAGGERVPAAWAGLVHGTLAHGLDYDDTHPASLVHPGSLVVPVALAVGEAASADGSRVLAAVAAGYEVAARLGAAAGRAFHARGFQATGVLGPVVGALVAGTLYGLPPGRVAEAMGLGGSMGGGLLEFLSDGSWSKRLHPGWAGHGGILAAQLAGAGFSGPASVLEGRYGLYRAFLGSDAADPSAVARDLGRRWLSRETEAKLYPCAHVLQPYLDAALALRAAHALEAATVAAVECRVPAWAVPIVAAPPGEKAAPRTEYQARASLPFALAAALVDGRVGLETFTPEAVARPELLDLAARVRCVETAGHAGAWTAALRVTTTEGRTLGAEVAPGGPPAPARVRAKFRETAGRLLPPERVHALAEAVETLDRRIPAELLALCRVGEGAPRGGPTPRGPRLA